MEQKGKSRSPIGMTRRVLDVVKMIASRPGELLRLNWTDLDLDRGGARCSQDQAQKDRLANPDNHASGLLHQVYENRRIVGPVDAPIFIRTDSRTPGARGLRRILTGCGQSCVRLPASPRTGGTTCERYVFETPFTDGHNKGRYFVSKRRQPSQSGGRPARL